MATNPATNASRVRAAIQKGTEASKYANARSIYFFTSSNQFLNHFQPAVMIYIQP